MERGYFLSFEGIDGAGKSSHITTIADLLRSNAFEVIVTREPGGTDLAEKLRQLILNDAMDPMTEALLVFAARRDHIQKVIRPALADGKVVLCDRFTDSTWAYQGYGRGFNHGVLDRLEDWVQRDHLWPAAGGELLQPDATFLYDLEPTVAARRLAGARQPDRFEAEQAEFFERVRNGYLSRASGNARFIKINADQDREAVWADVRSHVLQLFDINSQESREGLTP
jgi:dTMP kinase